MPEVGISSGVISADDIRELLSGEPDAVLVVVGGRTSVVGPAALDAQAYRGALQVISRSELLARSGERLSDREITEQAAALDTAFTELGG